MSTEDRLLVRRWLNERDPDAFKDIVNKYANMVFAVCKRILRNDADAEDTTQESFLVLAKGKCAKREFIGAMATHRRHRSRIGSCAQQRQPAQA